MRLRSDRKEGMGDNMDYVANIEGDSELTSTKDQNKSQDDIMQDEIYVANMGDIPDDYGKH